MFKDSNKFTVRNGHILCVRNGTTWVDRVMNNTSFDFILDSEFYHPIVDTVIPTDPKTQPLEKHVYDVKNDLIQIREKSKSKSKSKSRSKPKNKQSIRKKRRNFTRLDKNFYTYIQDMLTTEGEGDAKEE